jgi:SAM-dependent methyltransferase
VIPDSYFEGFVTPKYRSRNPVQRTLIRGFLEKMSDFFGAASPSKAVLEVGCGEGFIAGHLSKNRPDILYVGVDQNEDDLRNLRAKFPSVETHRGSVYDLSFLGRNFDLVICAEVLEHLSDPEAALAQITALRPRKVILTVPLEPWFCLGNLARGKNVRRLGNDPDHVNLWGRRGFRKLASRHLVIERHEISFPWQLILGRPAQ